MARTVGLKAEPKQEPKPKPAQKPKPKEQIKAD